MIYAGPRTPLEQRDAQFVSGKTRSFCAATIKKTLQAMSIVITSIRGPILEFARGSFPSTFPRLSNETPPTAFSKSHRSRFLERKVRVVFTVRHANLVYEIAGIKLL